MYKSPKTMYKFPEEKMYKSLEEKQDPEESWHENYWVQVDPKVPADPMVDPSTDPVDPSTDPVDPNNHAVVNPTDKPVGPVVGPAVGPVDKPDVGPEFNIDKPSAVGPERNHKAHY
ncbi:hypothetical protein Tco_0791421 [Tanacetum coccineum]